MMNIISFVCIEFFFFFQIFFNNLNFGMQVKVLDFGVEDGNPWGKLGHRKVGSGGD